MKQKLLQFSAAIFLSILLPAGVALAEPAEACSFAGQQGYSYEQIGLRTGWHLWQCYEGEWQYAHFCGRAPC